MSIAVAIALVLAGFFMLMWSADILVDNASELANRLGVSTFLVGIIVVGFGTSAPELFVSAMAALENRGNLALGNALGSNITNIGLVLGSAAFIRALPVSRSSATRDIPIVLAAGLLAVFLVSDGLLSNIDGLILIAVLTAYLLWSAKTSRHSGEAVERQADQKATWTYAVWTIASIVLLILASRILVEGAVTIAEFFGVGELIIGLTIVAIGTSLPELAAAIAAARKGVHDMIIGNIIGSNVFNTLGVLGVTGTLQATSIDTGALWRDFPIMFVFTVAMLVFALTRGSLNRIEGGVLLGGYFSYLAYLFYVAV